MPKKLIHGIVPALVTPFTSKNTVNLDIFPLLYQKTVIEGGCSGLYVCGTSSEAKNLKIDERMLISETLIKINNKRIPIIVQVGATQKTEDSVKLARHAEKIGADAVSSLPPLNETGDLEQIIEHYRKIGEAINIPFYVYWMDMKLTNINAKVFLKEMRKVPNFSGIKFTDYNLFLFQRIATLKKFKLNMLSGYDQVCLAGLIMGSDGAIGSTYNIMPKLFNKMYSDFQKGNIRACFDAQIRANNFIELLTEPKIDTIPGVKAVLNSQGINVGNPRPPLKSVSKENTKRLLQAVKDFRLS